MKNLKCYPFALLIALGSLMVAWQSMAQESTGRNYYSYFGFYPERIRHYSKEDLLELEEADNATLSTDDADYEASKYQEAVSLMFGIPVGKKNMALEGFYKFVKDGHLTGEATGTTLGGNPTTFKGHFVKEINMLGFAVKGDFVQSKYFGLYGRLGMTRWKIRDTVDKEQFVDGTLVRTYRRNEYTEQDGIGMLYGFGVEWFITKGIAMRLEYQETEIDEIYEGEGGVQLALIFLQ